MSTRHDLIPPFRFRLAALLTCWGLFLVGCAHENPDLVNPPPNSNNVGLRFYNVVPDGQSRVMQLEMGIATPSIPPSGFSAVVNSPGDSSHIAVVRGSTTEYKTSTRVRFTRNQVVDVFALPKANMVVPAFDTIMMQTANAVLITTSNANVRLVNAFPDSTAQYVLRLGCPNGPAFPSSIGDSAVRFRAASLYGEIPNGLAVFSVVERKNGTERTVQIIQFDAAVKTPYSVILYESEATRPDPAILLIDEADLTANANRTVLPVVTRTGYMRVLNASSQTIDVQRLATSQVLATNLQTRGLSAISEVPTCESYVPDAFEVRFSDGVRDTDSVSLNVRQNYTLIATDSGAAHATIMVKPVSRPDNAAGNATFRVVHAASKTGKVTVSIGARTDATSATNVSSGFTIVRDLPFEGVTGASAIAPGELPITITTSNTPTTVLGLVRTTILADHSYMLVLRDKTDGGIEVMLIDETDQNTITPALDEAVMVRFVNGSPDNAFQTASIGAVVQNAIVYYRNSLATCVRPQRFPVSAGSASTIVDPTLGQRVLCIYAEGGGVPQISTIITPPMSTIYGQSERRVINATSDIPFVSCAYDSIPSQTPGAEKLADKVGYGLWSTPDLTTRERRGTFYFYDSSTFTKLYTLPVQFGALGNSYSLIVTGSKSVGYDVIVLQEF